MQSQTYLARRDQLEAYFDRTAAEAWAKLTADGPVSRIRATVRAGRDRMRDNLLSALPEDLAGRRLLDAGCGTGALAVEAARRGAEVVAVDLSPTLVDLARERAPGNLGAGRVDFRVGDMIDDSMGRFDYVVAMDSLIHYDAPDLVDMVSRLAARADEKVVFTFAPRTVLLSLMHLAGRLFPRGDRAPMIAPIAERKLRRHIAVTEGLGAWADGQSVRVDCGFYISQTMELVRR